jgi:hypothetical protein
LRPNSCLETAGLPVLNETPRTTLKIKSRNELAEAQRSGDPERARSKVGGGSDAERVPLLLVGILATVGGIHLFADRCWSALYGSHPGNNDRNVSVDARVVRLGGHELVTDLAVPTASTALPPRFCRSHPSFGRTSRNTVRLIIEGSGRGRHTTPRPRERAHLDCPGGR